MNSLSTQKRISFILPFLILTSCQSFRTRDEIQKNASKNRSGSLIPILTSQKNEFPTSASEKVNQIEEDEDENSINLPPPLVHPSIPAMPKIGLILGAGGAKTYAHIGFLKELGHAKVPIHAVGGVEFAAPMAALYANKEQPNDVEWQMFKLREEDLFKKTLLGVQEKNAEVTELKEFLGGIFARSRVEEFRIPFACPSFNLSKNQVYLMNRGGLDQLMYMCMAYPPHFKTYENNLAGVREVTSLANYLRSKGANLIVFVNVLQSPSIGKPFTPEVKGTDNIVWSEIAGLYNRPIPGVDSVVHIDTSSFGLMDFEKKREIMNKGAESAAKQMRGLARKWGF